MGVRELWTVLAPVKEQLPISALAGKTLAVDLSGWVCQASSIPRFISQLHNNFPLPYTRRVATQCRVITMYVKIVSCLN